MFKGKHMFLEGGHIYMWKMFEFHSDLLGAEVVVSCITACGA